jgi:TetR/AcrR family fatty acid metabolism transcriptional regulator
MQITKRKDSNQRKIEIIETTRNLIFNNGFSNFTIRAVANIVGISEAAIYKHFSNKEELLLELLDSLFQPWQSTLASLADSRAKPENKIIKIAETHIDFLIEKQLNPILFFSEAINPDNKKLRLVLQTNLGFLKATVKKALEEGINDGSFQSDLNVGSAAACITGIIQSSVIKWTIMGTDKKLKSETRGNIKFFLAQIEQNRRLK